MLLVLPPRCMQTRSDEKKDIAQQQQQQPETFNFDVSIFFVSRTIFVLYLGLYTRIYFIEETIDFALFLLLLHPIKIAIFNFHPQFYN